MIISPLLRIMIRRTRTFLIFAYLTVSLFHSCTGLLFYVHNTTNIVIKYFPWVIFVALIPYGMLASLIGPAQFVLRGELLPLSVRALGGSMAIITGAATGFVILKIFFPINEYFGIEINFWFYAIMAFSQVIVLYLCLPARRSEPMSSAQNIKNITFQVNNNV